MGHIMEGITTDWSKWDRSIRLTHIFPRCFTTNRIIWPWQPVYYRKRVNNLTGIDYEFISEQGLVLYKLHNKT